MSFARPDAWLLLLLPLALLPWWRWLSPRRRAAIVHSEAPVLGSVGRTLATRLRWLPMLLRSLAIAGLVVALARPVRANERSPVVVEGIAIELVIDRSISMGTDFSVGARRMDRLAVVKRVVEDFILGTRGPSGLAGRANDLVGLVVFARHADSLCPLTLDHGNVVNALRQTRVASTRAEDGTAIGDGVALGVERLRELLEQPRDGSRRIRSGVMILLTDGENNAGTIDPATAAQLAAAYGIRIYAIGAGDAFGLRAPTRAERTLRAMADTTGGRFFVATSPGSLDEIYREIDRLERTETEQRRYRLESDLAVEPFRAFGRDMPPMLVVVFVLLLAEGVLWLTRLRPLP